MSYIQQSKSHVQIDPTFMPGYNSENLPKTIYRQQYHNIGQLASPYLGKTGVGDYSWPQHTSYYTQNGCVSCYNDNYPYPLEARNTYAKDCSRSYPQDFRCHPFYKFNVCFP